MEKMTLIKKDALIELKVGTSFVSRLQKLMIGILADKTPEEIQKYNELCNQNTLEFPESWMEDLTTVNALLMTIEQEAKKSGQTYEVDVNDPTLE